MKKNKLPSLVTILILTLITAGMWALFNVYRAFTIKPSPSVAQEILEPLTPTLDSETLKNIEGRIFLNDSEIPEVSAPAP